jgi:hypothetical protein
MRILQRSQCTVLPVGLSRRVCTLKANRLFGRNILFLRPVASYDLAYFTTMKMEAKFSSETSAILHRTTRQYIPGAFHSVQTSQVVIPL